MNPHEEHPHPQPAGPEEGLRSGSTAGDSHGATTDSPDRFDIQSDSPAELTPAQLREQQLKED